MFAATEILEARKAANRAVPYMTGIAGLLGGAALGHSMPELWHHPAPDAAHQALAEDADAFYASRDPSFTTSGPHEPDISAAPPEGPALPHALDPYIHDGKPGWLPPVTSPTATEVLNQYGRLPDSAKVTAVDVLTRMFDPGNTGHPTINAGPHHATAVEPAIRDALNEQGAPYSLIPNSVIDSKIHEGLKPIWPLLEKTNLGEERQLAEVMQAHARSLPEYQAMRGQLRY